MHSITPDVKYCSQYAVRLANSYVPNRKAVVRQPQALQTGHEQGILFTEEMVSEWSRQRGLVDDSQTPEYDSKATEKAGLALDEPFQENIGEMEFKTQTQTTVEFVDKEGTTQYSEQLAGGEGEVKAMGMKVKVPSQWWKKQSAVQLRAVVFTEDDLQANTLEEMQRRRATRGVGDTGTIYVTAERRQQMSQSGISNGDSAPQVTIGVTGDKGAAEAVVTSDDYDGTIQIRTSVKRVAAPKDPQFPAQLAKVSLSATTLATFQAFSNVLKVIAPGIDKKLNIGTPAAHGGSSSSSSSSSSEGGTST